MTRFSYSLGLLLIGCMLVCSGCGGKDKTPAKDGKSTDGGKGTGGGKKSAGGGNANSAQEDPLEVLKAFVAAIRAKDKDKCLALVHPDNREELGRDMQKGFPPIPESAELKVTPAADGKTATFSGVPPLKNLKLRKVDGKWWIAD